MNWYKNLHRVIKTFQSTNKQENYLSYGHGSFTGFNAYNKEGLPKEKYQNDALWVIINGKLFTKTLLEWINESGGDRRFTHVMVFSNIFSTYGRDVMAAEGRYDSQRNTVTIKNNANYSISTKYNFIIKLLNQKWPGAKVIEI